MFPHWELSSFLKPPVHTTTFSLTRFPLTTCICSCALHKVVFTRVGYINWQVFPWQEAVFKSWSRPAFEQGKLFACTARQGKLVHSSKCANIVVKENVSAVHTSKQNFSRKTCGEKIIVHCTHEQVKLPRNLSRKTYFLSIVLMTQNRD